MKKVSRVIAMLLILMILASGFTGCATSGELEKQGIDKGTQVGIILFGGALLGLCWGVLLIHSGLTASAPVYNGEKIAALDQEENSPFTAASYSLPETEHAVLKKNLDALRKAELVSFMNVLQHIEADYSPSDNSLYIGIRFRY